MAKTGQDQHLELSPESHILFYKVFFDKDYSNPPKEISLAGNLKVSPGSHFFLSLIFSKFGTGNCPPRRKGAANLILGTEIFHTGKTMASERNGRFFADKSFSTTKKKDLI